jgi:hypothetical protein
MRNILKPARYVAALAAVALLVPGCGSGVQFVRQDMTEYPAKDKDAQIGVFDGDISRPHVVIGTLTLDREVKASFGDSSTYDQVLEEMMAYARRIGADALIRVRPLNDAGSMSARVAVTATAVRYLREHQVVTSN